MPSTSTASPPTSSLTFLTPEGEERSAPPEWAEGLVALDVPLEAWEEVRLLRNGEEMPLSIRHVGGQSRVVAEWPLSGTGHYELAIEGVGEAAEAVTTWTVEPRKISPAAYRQLLAELEGDLPVSVAVGLQRLGAIAGLKLLPATESTLAQELVRLRRAVEGSSAGPGLALVLPEIARDPHQILKSTEVWVPRDRARRVHPTRLVQAIASGHNLGEDGIPERLPELRVEPNADVYENRLVKTFHEQVDRRLRRLIPMLERLEEVELLEWANGLLRSLEAARRQARFLDEVTTLVQSPSDVTMVLLKRPAYRRALAGYIEFRRSAAVQFDDPDLEAPLKNLPYLYETWGILQVIREVLALAPQFGFVVRHQELIRRDLGGVFVRVLRDGRAALVLTRDETTVRVIPQRSYTRSGDPLRSVSFTQKPDVVVEVARPGLPVEVYLFDPKYKLSSEADSTLEVGGRPKKEDIDTMHAYRDAIRDELGRRVVKSAAILYPGPMATFGSGLAALPAVPGEEDLLREEIRSALLPAFSPAAPTAAI